VPGQTQKPIMPRGRVIIELIMNILRVRLIVSVFAKQVRAIDA
jgi:hypothetical protein